MEKRARRQQEEGFMATSALLPKILIILCVLFSTLLPSIFGGPHVLSVCGGSSVPLPTTDRFSLQARFAQYSQY